MQLVIHVVQNCRAREQEMRWYKTNKENRPFALVDHVINFM